MADIGMAEPTWPNKGWRRSGHCNSINQQGRIQKMKLPSILSGLVLTLFGVMPASAADPMKFALCYDLTKVYTFVTPQVAQAAKDYADLLNLKGGIEGHPVEMIVKDHGNEPHGAIEGYEQMKREGGMVFDIGSTPVWPAEQPPAL